MTTLTISTPELLTKKEKETDKIFQWIKKIALILTVFISFVFIFNIILIKCFNPGDLQLGAEKYVNQKFGTVTIYTTENLRSGGIGTAFSAETPGYVNLFEPDKNIYLRKSTVEDYYGGKLQRKSFLYKHEKAHIEQKEMVANKAGGYPELYNPITTVKYTYYLFKLDSYYKNIMPEFQDNKTALFRGLESAADCRAIPKDQTDAYTGRYIKPEQCTEKQRLEAFKGISGEYPKI